MAIFTSKTDNQKEAVAQAAAAVKRASEEARRAIARLVITWENEDCDTPPSPRQRVNGGHD